MLLSHNALAGKKMNRSSHTMTSLAADVAAAYHGVRRAAMPLDILPGRNPTAIWYCCRQLMITPSPFQPLLPEA